MKESVGIDISDHSIEVLQINKDREILAFGRGTLDDSVIENGDILNPAKLQQALNSLFEEINLYPKKAALNIPESRAYIHRLDIPAHISQENIRDEVKKAAEAKIIADLDLMYWDYEILTANEKNTTKGTIQGGSQVLFVGVPQKIIEGLVHTLSEIHVEVVILEIESMSLYRALPPADQKKTKRGSSMIIDLGARKTGISIFDANGTLNHSQTIPIAGNYFTKKISENNKVDMVTAEKMKKAFGFRTDMKENLVLMTLKKCASEIVGEVASAIAAYETNTKDTIQTITIAGGTAMLPGLDTFISEGIGREILTGKPLQQLQETEISHQIQSIFFSDVVGLALRGFESSKTQINLIEQLRENIVKK